MDQKRKLEFFEQLLRMKPVYDRLCQIAESQLLQAVENSQHVLSDFKVAKGRCSRDWNVDYVTLEAIFGDEIFGDKPLLSVAQAEKKLGKSDVQKYIKTIEGNNKLVPKSSILSEVSINCNEFN